MEGELEFGFLSPARSSCVSSEGGGFGSPTWASLPEKLLDSPSSCVSDSRGNGGDFSSPTWESPLETLLDSPSSCVSHGRGGGNGGYRSRLGVSVEQGSEVREAERLLRAIAERYDDCFIRLRDATAKLTDLRRERLRLSAENLHLSLLLEDLETEQRKQASAVAPTPPPKPVEEAARGAAPKSISIRSKGYISQKQPQGEAEPQRLRVRAPSAMEVSPQILPLRIRDFIPPRTLLVHLVGNLRLNPRMQFKSYNSCKLVIIGEQFGFSCN